MFQKIWKSGTSQVITVPPFVIEQLGKRQVFIDWFEILKENEQIIVTSDLDRERRTENKEKWQNH